MIFIVVQVLIVLIIHVLLMAQSLHDHCKCIHFVTQDLVTRGEGWVRDVVLMVGSSDVTMKEDSTQVLTTLTLLL